MRWGPVRNTPLFALLLVAGCSATELHRPASSGFVEGHVATTQDGAVSGATVVASARRTPFAPLLAQDSTHTDASGHYQIMLETSELMEGDAVVQLSVRPPASEALVPTDTSIVAVHFSPTSPPTDTTRIGFRLAYKPD